MEDYKYDDWPEFPEEEVIDLTQQEDFWQEPILSIPWSGDAKDEKEEQIGDEEGENAAADWFFTFNNPDHPNGLEEFKKLLGLHCKAYGFQYEKGKSGTKHYQGEVSLLKKTRKPSKLFPRFKMWWQRTKNKNAAKNYCQNPLKEGFLEGPWVYGQTARSGKRTCFADARDAKTKEEAEALLWEGDPRAMMIHGDKISHNLAKRFKPAPLEEFPPYDNNTFVSVPVGMTAWVTDNIGIKKRRYPILVVEGKSQLGKTEWARSLGPHIYWKGNTNAKDLIENVEAQFLIIDDIAFGDLPKGFDKSVCLGSGKMVVTDKYLHKETIVWNKPCIFLCNNQGSMPWYTDEYWQDNAVVVKVNNKLY